MTKKKRNKKSRVGNASNYNASEVAKQSIRAKLATDDVAELIATAKELSTSLEDSGKEWLQVHEIDVDKFISCYSDVKNTVGDFDNLKPDRLKIIWDNVFGDKCNKFLEDYRTDANPNATDGDLKKAFMKQAFVEWKPAADSIADITEIENDYNNENAENVEHYTRKEFDFERQETIVKLRRRLTSMEAFGDDGKSIDKMRKRIRVMNERYSPDYVFDEYRDDYHARRRIVEQFFDNRRSDYIMHRFYDRCKQLRLNPDVLKLMINVEENYLDENYWVFNNFYIFALMSYAIYNVREKDASRELKYPVQCILNLVYNKFYSDDIKEEFLAHMRRSLDLFEEWRDLFDKSNQLHPKHPYRIQKDAERTAAYKAMIMGKLADEFPEECNKLVESGKDVKMTMSELEDYYLKLCDEREVIEEAVENADPSDIVAPVEDNNDSNSGESPGSSTSSDEQITAVVGNLDKVHLSNSDRIVIPERTTFTTKGTDDNENQKLGRGMTVPCVWPPLGPTDPFKIP